MQDNDLVKCPLCGGLAQLRRTELLAALNDKGLLDRLQRSLDTLAPAAQQELAGAAAGAAKPRDFQKDVHTWNPTLPMWTRSPKE
jgi:hypothetical protein